MPAFMDERPVLGPGADDEVQRLPELFPGRRRGNVVIEGLGPPSWRETGDDPPIGHHVEHGVFLGHAERIHVQRQEIAQHHDLGVAGDLGQGGGDQIG